MLPRKFVRPYADSLFSTSKGLVFYVGPFTIKIIMILKLEQQVSSIDCSKLTILLPLSCSFSDPDTIRNIRLRSHEDSFVAHYWQILFWCSSLRSPARHESDNFLYFLACHILKFLSASYRRCTKILANFYPYSPFSKIFLLYNACCNKINIFRT